MEKPDTQQVEEIRRTFREYYGEVPEWAEVMAQRAPEVLYHYCRMRNVALEDRVLPRSVKELILIGINLVRRYPKGIEVHVRGALEAGCTPDEIAEVIATAMVSGAACSLIEGPSILAAELEGRGRTEEGQATGDGPSYHR